MNLDESGINTNGSSIPANNIRITNCVIADVVSGDSNWLGAKRKSLRSRLTNSMIAENDIFTFFTGSETSAKDADAIAGWNFRGVSITDTVFDTVNQGLPVQFTRTGPYDGVLITRNCGALKKAS